MVLLASSLDKNIKCQKVFIFKGITAMNWLQVHNYIIGIFIYLFCAETFYASIYMSYVIIDMSRFFWNRFLGQPELVW